MKNKVCYYFNVEIFKEIKIMENKVLAKVNGVEITRKFDTLSFKKSK